MASCMKIVLAISFILGICAILGIVIYAEVDILGNKVIKPWQIVVLTLCDYIIGAIAFVVCALFVDYYDRPYQVEGVNPTENDEHATV